MNNEQRVLMQRVDVADLVQLKKYNEATMPVFKTHHAKFLIPVGYPSALRVRVECATL